jgi:hypothetical protein
MSDGFALCKFSIPFKVKSLLAVTPPVPLIVRLLTAPLNIDAGNVIADEFVKAIVAVSLLTLIKPLVLTGEFKRVNVFEPTVRDPLVKVKTPTMFTSPYMFTPETLFIVRLLSKKDGILILPPVPPIIIFVELPPVTVPVIAVTSPLKVNVFGPIVKLPAISAIPLFMVKSPFRVSPFTLFIVSESIVLLTNEPDGIF